MINKKHIKLFLLILVVGLNINCKSTQLLDVSDVEYTEPKDSINSNNVIYTENSEIIYNYYFLDKGDTLKCFVKGKTPQFGSKWGTKNIQDTVGLKNVINKIAIKIRPKKFFNQTYMSFVLLNNDNDNEEMKYSETGSGLIENKTKVWLHPFRIYEFGLNEFNPFPYVKYPLQKNTYWVDTVSPYPNSEYDKWLKFDKRIDCVSTYLITGKEYLTTPMGKLECYVIKGTATNPHGKGHLTSYFNEKYGFVKLDYTNIDGSKLIIDAIEIKQSKQTDE
jgi:hypothetical protein